VLNDPALANTPLGTIAGNLPISQLGAIASNPIGSLPAIASQYISNIPGLSNSPIAQAGVQLAMQILNGDIAAKLDIMYAGPKETPKKLAYTVSTRGGKSTPAPCAINGNPKKPKKGQTTNCDHFELGNLTTGINRGKYKGMGMMNGDHQPVKGGMGILAKINDGWEPTGWKPWTDEQPIKVSLKNLKEVPGSTSAKQKDTSLLNPQTGQTKLKTQSKFNPPAQADIQGNLQICVKPPFGKKTCTPHFLPIPSPFNSILQFFAICRKILSWYTIARIGNVSQCSITVYQNLC
jgi:hypothetical protein